MTVPVSEYYTEASRRFMEALLELEPGTQNGGLYAYKAGYHNTRENLLNHTVNGVHVWRNDYSIRDAVDRLGPADKSAAYDWTFPRAQGGDFSRIKIYGDRLRRAWEARDPRLDGWREVLIQADNDFVAEGYDFRYHTVRTPSIDHNWHGHFSEDRAEVESWLNKAKMLSVLSARPVEDWIDGGGDDDMKADERAALGECLLILSLGQRGNVPQLIPPAQNQSAGGLGRPISWLPGKLWDLGAADTSQTAMLNAVTLTLQAMAETLSAAGGSVDSAVIIARMNELAEEADADRTAMQATITGLTTALAEANSELDRVKAALQAGEAAQAVAVTEALNKE